jgi:hypothetical protein
VLLLLVMLVVKPVVLLLLLLVLGAPENLQEGRQGRGKNQHK